MVSSMAVLAQGDFKMKQKSTAAGRTSESAIMIKGSRERTEMETMGLKSITILQCDLKQMVRINENEKKYMIEPFGADAPAVAPSKTTTTSKVKNQKGGTVTQTVELIDTGERKQFFGYTARRIKTVTTTEPSADACEKDAMRIETDGWYIDLTAGLVCKTDRGPERPIDQDRGRSACEDNHKFSIKGSAKLGYAISLTTKMGMPEMEEMDAQTKAMMAQMGMAGGQMTMNTEITELSKATLDQSLFEIPAGYTLVTDPAKFYGKTAQRDISESVNKSGGTQSIMPAGMAAATKRPGTMRVGVLTVGNSSGKQLNTSNFQQMLASQIAGDKFDAIAVTSESDALAKGCDYILTTDIKALKQSAAGRIGGMFGKVTGSSSGSGKVEAIVSYSLSGITPNASASFQSEANAKIEGEEASVMSALSSAAQAVVKALKK